jgi:hypothetical protein
MLADVGEIAAGRCCASGPARAAAICRNADPSAHRRHQRDDLPAAEECERFDGPCPAKAGSPVIVDSYLRISAVIVHDNPLASVKWRLMQLRTLFWRHGQDRPATTRPAKENRQFHAGMAAP